MSFLAQFGGTCGDCDERFNAGAHVTYDRYDQVVHVQCPGQPDDISMGDGQPCERCFCYHKGEC